MYWIWIGSDEIAKLLIEHGADVNIPENTYGYTPLHQSAMMSKNFFKCWVENRKLMIQFDKLQRIASKSLNFW